ncbi:COQ5 [Scenedesmus sp. PABB004]|nr:COQ5 [Scenedesmus sp. PABB004]
MRALARRALAAPGWRALLPAASAAPSAARALAGGAGGGSSAASSAAAVPPPPPQQQPQQQQPGSPEEDEVVDFGFRTVRRDEKQALVGRVFSNVASSYDLMNDLMSGGLHRLWKDRLVESLAPFPGQRHLDVAGGTGDVAFRVLRAIRAAERLEAQAQAQQQPPPPPPPPRQAAQHAQHAQPGPQQQAQQAAGQREQQAAPGRVTVFDINAEMLEVGKSRAAAQGLSDGLSWLQGNAEALPLPDGCMDSYTVAFGIRNMTHRDAALSEARRVLRRGGRLLCLEFSRVSLPLLAQAYDAYSFAVIPKVGGLVANDEASYQYLVESIRQFPDQEAWAAQIRAAGFKAVTAAVAALVEGVFSGAAAAALLDDQTTWHDALVPGAPLAGGAAGVAALAAALRGAAGDLAVAVDEVVCLEQRHVLAYYTASGTHTGPLAPPLPPHAAPATGRPVRWTGSLVLRLVDDARSGGDTAGGVRAAAAWHSWDPLFLCEQVGAAPGGVPRAPPHAPGGAPPAPPPGAARQLSPEACKAVVRRYFEIYNSGDYAALPGIVHPGYRYHGLIDLGGAAGVAGMHAMMDGWRAALAPFSIGHEWLLAAEGGRVVFRWVLQGEHTGAPLRGVPADAATPRRVRAAGVTALSIVPGDGGAGLIWLKVSHANGAELLRQLGALRQPGAA